MTETTEELIQVPLQDNSIKSGDTVLINMQHSLGLKAVLIAYVFPFLATLISIIILTEIGVHEAIAGLIGLGVLVPYFILLKNQKKYLHKTFTFNIRKVN